MYLRVNFGSTSSIVIYVRIDFDVKNLEFFYFVLENLNKITVWIT